ncbi:MAG: hypothetical protein JXQ76_12830 [Campylobacterales bacterium]|nr:hypothetical protein [Campylobacterales bacterium]
MNFEYFRDNTLIIHRASVFKWQDYTFGNGDSKDKFWITLNCKINEFPINAILPTSKYDKRYYSKAQSLRDTIVLEANESQFFPRKTLIDLKNIIQQEESEVRDAFEDEYLVYLGELEESIMQKIETAIRNSEILEPFKISEYLCEE